MKWQKQIWVRAIVNFLSYALFSTYLFIFDNQSESDPNYAI